MIIAHGRRGWMVGSFAVCLVVFAIFARPARAAEEETPRMVLQDVLRRWADIVEPRAGQPPKAYVAKMKVTKAVGLPLDAAFAWGKLVVQAPDRLRASVVFTGHAYHIGRDGERM